MWLRDAVRRDRLPTLKQLDDPRWFPYRYGQALWAFLSERFGDDLAARALASKAKGGAIGRLVATTGVDAATLTRDWHASLRATFGTPAERFGRRASPHPILIAGQKGDVGRYNVGPALSPDGRYVVFLSERGGYSIDVFLAETATGKIIRKLVSTAARSALRQPAVPGIGGRVGRARITFCDGDRAGAASRCWRCSRCPPALSRWSARSRISIRSTRRRGRRTAPASSFPRCAAAPPISTSSTWHGRDCAGSRTTPTPISSRRGRRTDGRSRSSPTGSRRR